jgi:hypothetical protein
MFDTLVGIEEDPKKKAEMSQRRRAITAEEDQYGAQEYEKYLKKYQK